MQAAFSGRTASVTGRPAVVCRPASAVRASPAVVRAATTYVNVDEETKGWKMSYYPTKADTAKANKDWYIIDAKDQTLGRLACLASRYIRGKHAPTYTPSMDMGAMLIIVNAEKVTVTGRKFDDKLYKRHVNGLPGSMKQETFKQLQARIPERIIEKAVFGMLPKGRLGQKIKLNMKIYSGSEHPHEAQAPEDITHRINAPK